MRPTTGEVSRSTVVSGLRRLAAMHYDVASATLRGLRSRTLRLRDLRSVVVAAMAVALLTPSVAAPTQAAITTPYTPTFRTDLWPGVSYERGTMWTSGDRRQAVHIARVQPSRPDVRLKTVLSDDRVVGKLVVRRMVDERRRAGFRPMVAINGDMAVRGRIDAYAAPRSMAVSNRELLVAFQCVKPILGIEPDGTARIANVRSHITLSLPGESEPRRVERVNTHRDDEAVVLFTERFARSTRTKPGGVEVILKLEGRVKANGTQTVRVMRVFPGAGDTHIPKGMAVLSVNDPEDAWVYGLLQGQYLTLETQIVKRVDKSCAGKVKPADGWDDIVEAQGGNRRTVKDGVTKVPSREEYPPGWERHPRTALGLTAEGEVLMVVVDGRRKGSRGMTLGEMGYLMVSLGAEQAFNLDGGGSSVMARFDKRTKKFVVANKPSDGRQRPATQAFAAFQVKVPS